MCVVLLCDFFLSLSLFFSLTAFVIFLVDSTVVVRV